MVIILNVLMKTKQWGNSVGMIIPAEIVKDLSIHPGEEVVVEIKKKENPLKELWGAFKMDKNWKKEFKKHRKEMEGKWI